MQELYSSPVAHLLNYEQCEATGAEDWPDYVNEFGFTEAHIPELLRLMQHLELYEWNPETEPAPLEGLDPDLAWSAPIHAWRVLGQLKTPEFLQGAITVLENDAIKEWGMAEFPDLCKMVGPAVIAPLEHLIKENLETETEVASLIESLAAMPQKYPEERDRCVGILQDALRHYPDNSKFHNTFLVSGLLDLKAVEAVDLLEQVYQAKAVDEMFVGNWAQAQIDLGLKNEADFTEAELTPEMPPEMLQIRETMAALERLNKPDAFQLGMPMAPSAFPTTKPPGFDDMMRPHSDTHHESQKGFGGTPGGKKKGKKKKKKQ